MTDEGALERLREAVAAAPTDHELRLLLARRLLDGGLPDASLVEVRQVLDDDPAHVAALRLAAGAADAAGQHDRAVGYRRLLAALGSDDHRSELTSADLPDAEAGLSEDALHQSDPDLAMVGDFEVPDDLRDLVEAPGVTLADVAGMDHVKRRLEAAFLGPLRNPELREAFGTSLRGGLMLYGPPGCGKTFLARALAGELGAGFLTIGIVDVLDPYLGVAEQQLHQHFEAARRTAPCVVFLDEIDALGQKRSQLRGSAARGVVNQLLAELDSVEGRNDGVFVLAATNHPWDVDTALRRPGRFDRTVLVLPPDAEARRAILSWHLRDRPTGALDLAKVAEVTGGYSGADLAHLCQTAVEFALERSVSGGQVSPVTQADLKRALKEVRSSTGPWLEVARNYALYANEGGEYDELAAYLRARKLL